ncbi:hypothetical protein VTJ83DRAFT_578 [Remersonia thermophila]|uniref:Uncharacterized protein n=1 Tax=Remersonia thermophila TaxID=72144 RepID=A0ABR4DLI9_9PEZI
MSTLQSSGRGGAGNIVDASKAPKPQPSDLQTPTLKTSVVTTGRGGTGNFASGLDDDEKRRRQDVEPVVRREAQNATHIGRGGTGNVARPVTAGLSEEEAAALAKTLSTASDKGAALDDKTLTKTKTPSPPADADADEALQKQRTTDSANAPAQAPGLLEKGLNLLFRKK